MKYITFLFIFFSFLSASHGQKSKCTENKSYNNATYIGCLDYEGNPSGHGIMTFDNGQVYDGDWLRGEMEGSGVMTFDDGQVYDGGWVRGEMEGSGVMTDSNGQVYDGQWKNNSKNGQGILTIINKGQIQKSEGFFVDNQLLTGVKEIDFGNGMSSVSQVENKKIIERILNTVDCVLYSYGKHRSDGQLENGTKKYVYEDNIVIESEVFDGVETEIKNNTKNYCIENDIVGKDDFIAVDLERDGNSMIIYLGFSTETTIEPVRFVFDTGAEVFSIGFRLFDYLKKNGLKYDDLNIVVQGVGVSGVPSDNKLIKIHELKIGSYTVKNIVAYVETLPTANMSLLGVSFMKKFSEVQWSLTSDKLIFYK